VTASMAGGAFYEVAWRGATEDFPEGSFSHREALMYPVGQVSFVDSS